jgi:hypothetical protein
VQSIAKAIAADIRSQYVIGYRSSNPQTAGSYHAIQAQPLRERLAFECQPVRDTIRGASEGANKGIFALRLCSYCRLELGFAVLTAKPNSSSHSSN